jgi:hypothetical protein
MPASEKKVVKFLASPKLNFTTTALATTTTSKQITVTDIHFQVTLGEYSLR